MFGKNVCYYVVEVGLVSIFKLLVIKCIDLKVIINNG